MPDAAAAAPLLELDRVSKTFGRVVVADELSLTIGPADLVGIVGPNGAGKTSLFGLISGDLRPASGEIRFNGDAITRLDPAARCRLGIGRTYQGPRPFTDMTVFETVLVAAQQGGGLRRRASYAAAVLANPAVREVFLGSEVTASLSGGTLTAEVGDPGEGA